MRWCNWSFRSYGELVQAKAIHGIKDFRYATNNRLIIERLDFLDLNQEIELHLSDIFKKHGFTASVYIDGLDSHALIEGPNFNQSKILSEEFFIKAIVPIAYFVEVNPEQRKHTELTLEGLLHFMYGSNDRRKT